MMVDNIGQGGTRDRIFGLLASGRGQLIDFTCECYSNEIFVAKRAGKEIVRCVCRI